MFRNLSARQRQTRRRSRARSAAFVLHQLQGHAEGRLRGREDEVDIVGLDLALQDDAATSRDLACLAARERYEERTSRPVWLRRRRRPLRSSNALPSAGPCAWGSRETLQRSTLPRRHSPTTMRTRCFSTNAYRQ